MVSVFFIAPFQSPLNSGFSGLTTTAPIFEGLTLKKPLPLKFFELDSDPELNIYIFIFRLALHQAET